jgi:hypothetical protein
MTGKIPADCKHSNLLVEISNCVGNRRENRKTAKSVPSDSPVGQNEALGSIGCHTQPSEPIGEKNTITCPVLQKPFVLL